MNLHMRRLWIALLILALMSPFGILLPRLFHAENAWGEWSTEQLDRMLGYVPEGLRRIADVWRAPLPDYSFGSEAGAPALSISYIASAFIGVALVVLLCIIVSKIFIRQGK